MRAVVIRAYGAAEELDVTELPTPTPGSGEVLVQVHATTVTMGDTELRSMTLPWLFRLPLRLWLGWSRPRPHTIPGMEFSGTVASIGPGVTGWTVGERVFGAPDMGFGANASHIVMPAAQLFRMPDGLSFEAAATLPIGGLEAIGYLRKAGTPKRLLIRGASGSIGTFALQLAKQAGAHVTAVVEPAGVERVTALGADVVRDHTLQEFDAGDDRYDAMIDIVGKIPLSRCLAIVEPGGAVVRCTVPGLWEVLVGLWTRLTSDKRVRMGEGGGSRADLEHLAAEVAAGRIETVIDRVLPLDEVVEAHRYVETGSKQGHVVLRVAAAVDQRPLA